MNIAKFLRTAFFIEHLWWLLLPFTTTFRNYYWEDLVVILFALNHPSKRLKTFLKLITCYTTKTLKKVLGILQVVHKETHSLLLTFNRFQFCFRVSVVDFEYLFAGLTYFKDLKNNNDYSIPFPANKYMLKVATETLEITEDNQNENVFKKQSPLVLI